MKQIGGEGLRPFLHNVLSAETDPDGTIRLYRFTER